MYPFANANIIIKGIVINGIGKKFSKFELGISGDVDDVKGIIKEIAVMINNIPITMFIVRIAE
jgi:hypothetical protein